MLPHPETVIAISALRYQERLYEVARQRRAFRRQRRSARATDPDLETRASCDRLTQTNRHARAWRERKRDDSAECLVQIRRDSASRKLSDRERVHGPHTNP
jgi:hypothetical protein